MEEKILQITLSKFSSAMLSNSLSRDQLEYRITTLITTDLVKKSESNWVYKELNGHWIECRGKYTDPSIVTSLYPNVFETSVETSPRSRDGFGVCPISSDFRHRSTPEMALVSDHTFTVTTRVTRTSSHRASSSTFPNPSNCEAIFVNKRYSDFNRVFGCQL